MPYNCASVTIFIFLLLKYWRIIFPRGNVYQAMQTLVCESIRVGGEITNSLSIPTNIPSGQSHLVPLSEIGLLGGAIL